eukprot:Skav221862  [mRNA]  locus=scaffold1175:415412:415651:+ [translate_table: standard]
MVASLQNGSMAWGAEEATLGKWRRDARGPSWTSVRRWPGDGAGSFCFNRLDVINEQVAKPGHLQDLRTFLLNWKSASDK